MVTTEFMTDEPRTMVAFVGATVAADTPAEVVANVAVGCRSIGRGELMIVGHGHVAPAHRRRPGAACVRRFAELRGRCCLALTSVVTGGHDPDGRIILD